MKCCVPSSIYIDKYSGHLKQSPLWTLWVLTTFKFILVEAMADFFQPSSHFLRKVSPSWINKIFDQSN